MHLSVLQDLEFFGFSFVLLVVQGVLEQDSLVQPTAHFRAQLFERVVFFFEAHGDVLVDQIHEKVQRHLARVADDRVGLRFSVRGVHFFNY